MRDLLEIDLKANRLSWLMAGEPPLDPPPRRRGIVSVSDEPFVTLEPLWELESTASLQVLSSEDLDDGRLYPLTVDYYLSPGGGQLRRGDAGRRLA